MAHIPTLIRELDKDERITSASSKLLIQVDIYYSGGVKKHWFEMPDFANMTDEQALEQALEGLQEMVAGNLHR